MIFFLCIGNGNPIHTINLVDEKKYDDEDQTAFQENICLFFPPKTLDLVQQSLFQEGRIPFPTIPVEVLHSFIGIHRELSDTMDNLLPNLTHSSKKDRRIEALRQSGGRNITISNSNGADIAGKNKDSLSLPSIGYGTRILSLSGKEHTIGSNTERSISNKESIANRFISFLLTILKDYGPYLLAIGVLIYCFRYSS